MNVQYGSTFSLLAPDFIANPYPFYRRIRRVDPVFKVPNGPWLITSYDDVNRVLRDRRFLKQAEQSFAIVYGQHASEQPVVEMLTRSVLMADPPAHRHLRGLMMKAFGAWRIADMRPHIQKVVDRLVDRAEASGRIEIVRDYGYALSLTVICDMFGIPEEDRPDVLDYFGFGPASLSGLPLERAEIENLNAQIRALEGSMRRLVEQRRRRPGNDLTTGMMQAEDSGERFSDDELIANLALLFLAGFETTANLIANGLLVLHQYPRELQRFKEEPGIAANAIDEFLRFETVVKYLARSPAEDIEIGGKLIRAGDWVFAFLAAANRDPAVFAMPDRLDIGRPNIRPLSFGGGLHVCIGAQLARLEAEIAISTLLRRLPPLKMDDLDKPKWRRVPGFRSLEELHASW
jgi:cytochrome P450